MAPSGPVVLAVMAHPDDIEFLCAGTLIRLRERAWRVVMVTMTAGDCGSATLSPTEISAVRRREAADSAALLAADYVCLEQKDGLVLLRPETIAATVELMRRVQPDLVITHAPVDYMLDHEQTSTIARHAAFCAPIRNFRTGATDPAPAGPRVPHLYYADPTEGRDLFGERVKPGLYVDISQVIDAKEAMLACHASQRDWLLAHHGIDEYLQAMRAWSAARGREVGVPYAEAFRQHLGHGYPQDDRLAALLG